MLLTPMRMPNAEYFSGCVGVTARSQESPMSELKEMAMSGGALASA